MTERIVLVDFAGTLVKAEMIEKANVFRANILQKSLPTKEQHADPESFYKVNREFVEKLTGLKSDAKIKYRENDLDFIELSGEDVQNQISTNLFQIGMYMVAKKYGKAIVPNGLIEQLQRVKNLGYKLAIVSGVRTDIISGMLQIAGIPFEFDYIYGQPPKLGVENQESDVEDLKTKGSVEYSLGDKLSDLERGKVDGCKSIFVKWGHPSGGEEEIADYTIIHPKELEGIIK
jgi:phosphoglycolate phosphatase-like HAD superfamily hydrolase